MISELGFRGQVSNICLQSIHFPLKQCNVIEVRIWYQFRHKSDLSRNCFGLSPVCFPQKFPTICLHICEKWSVKEHADIC